MASTPPSTSSSSRTCSATGCRPRRATPRRRTTGRASRDVDVLRPGRGAAPARHRAVRDRDAGARARLVDGRGADLPVGRQPPGHGASGRCPFCGSRQDQRAQLRLPRGRQGGADRRRRVQGGLVRRAAGATACAPPPASTRDGASRRRSTGTQVYTGASWLRLRSRTSSSGSGRASSSTAATPTTCCRMLWTWQYGDVGQHAGVRRRPGRGAGVDHGARIVMPAEKDLYFPPEDEAWEVVPHPATPSCGSSRRVGALRRRRRQPRGHRSHRRRGQGAAGRLTPPALTVAPLGQHAVVPAPGPTASVHSSGRVMGPSGRGPYRPIRAAGRLGPC